MIDVVMSDERKDDRHASRAARVLAAGILRRGDVRDRPPLERCDRYEILRSLGRGGMAEVFLAFDPRLNREVAVKVMLGTVADRQRFQREIEVLAALRHPHVVGILDAGVQDGRPYYVLEHMPGGTLGDVEHTPRQAARAVEQIARAVQAAHEQGVIHRDLKPSNVLLDEHGPRVADFGLARLHDHAITTQGTVLGTPCYMAPEQIGGTALDERADVYGLGAILYQLLTDLPPFLGDDFQTVARRVTQEPLTPPSDYDPDVPPGLEAIVLQALARDPARRFPSAGALAEALARWLGEPAGRASGSPVGWLPLVALVVLIAVGAGGLSWLALSAGGVSPAASSSAVSEEWRAWEVELATSLLGGRIGAPPRPPAGSAPDAVSEGFLSLAAGQLDPARIRCEEAGSALEGRCGQALAVALSARTQDAATARQALETSLHDVVGVLEAEPQSRLAAVTLGVVCRESLLWTLRPEVVARGEQALVDARQLEELARRATPRVPAEPVGPLAWARGAAIGLGTRPLYRPRLADLLAAGREQLAGLAVLHRASKSEPDAVAPRLLGALVYLRQLILLEVSNRPARVTAVRLMCEVAARQLDEIERLQPEEPLLPELRQALSDCRQRWD